MKNNKHKAKEKEKAPAKKIRKVKKASPLKTSKDFEGKNDKYQGFDHFWAIMANKHQLKPNWKSALKAHIKKLGFDSSDKYEAGLKHFLGK